MTYKDIQDIKALLDLQDEQGQTLECNDVALPNQDQESSGAPEGNNTKKVKPLYDHLEEATEENRYIFESRDRWRDGEWISPIFAFVRSAKAHPELRMLRRREALNLVQSKWLWQKHGVENPWQKEFCDVDSEEEAEIEFLSVWDAIRFVPGESPLHLALALADQKPLPIQNADTVGYKRFLSMVGWLQYLCRTRNILVPCRKTADLLGVSHETVARYRKMAVRDAYLVVVRKHRFSKHEREATEFRFDISRFPILRLSD
jgi:hypothetical protein